MSDRAFPTGTVTMLFTDIEGSTRLLGTLGEERYGALLADHRRLLREAFAAHGGREMDTQGDAFFYAFARARGAALAAVDAQRALARYDWPEGAECRVRMGLHTGEPGVGEEGYHGMGLHRGARIAHTAQGGQILLSATTADLIRDELPPGIRLRDLGEQRLKDLDRPERVYELEADDLPGPRAPPKRRRRAAALAAAGLLVLAAVAAAILLVTSGGSSSAQAGAAVSADSVGVFGAASGRREGEIPVGASPSAIAAGDGSIWVANIDAHTVSRVDPAKETTIDTIPVGSNPDGIAFGGGFVWVTNGLDGTVTEIDPNTNTPVLTIPVGSGPAGIATDSRYAWVANSNDGTVTRIDLRTGKPLPPIPVGASADGVAIGEGAVWVTSQASGTVTRIDEGSGAVVQPVQSGGGADAVAIGLGSVWVANNLAGTVTRIDPATNTVRATIPVGDGPNAVAVTDGAVWVSDELAGTLTRIDPATNAPAHSVPTGNRPEGLVVDGASLFVAVRASGTGHRGGTLTFVTPAIDTLDPALVVNNEQLQLLVLTGDGLIGFRHAAGSAGNALVPDLAVSIPTPIGGGRSYTFKLRPGIRYANGILVRPEDFRRGLERTAKLAGGSLSGYSNIVGVSGCLAAPKQPCDLSRGIAVDPVARTVTYHLIAPDPNFLYLLTQSSAFPVPAGTPLHRLPALQGTGPYEVSSFDPKTGIRFTRNPSFREWSRAAQPAGYPDVIDVRFGGTPDGRITTVLRGAADLASGVAAPSPAMLQSLRTRHLSQIRVNPWYSTWFVVFNTKVAPFDNVLARRALNFALDRAHLRDLALGEGNGKVTCQVLPPDIDGYRPYCPYTVAPNASGTWTGPDLVRARELVRRSGTAGERVTFFQPKWIEFSNAAGRYVVSVLDSIGYRAELRVAADPYRQASADRRVQVGFYAWGPLFAAPAGFIPPGLSCAATWDDGNTARFCDPALDREMARAEALQTTDPVQATNLWAKLDHQLTDAAPWAPFANGVVLEVVSKRVGNYQYNPEWGALLDQLWVR